LVFAAARVPFCEGNYRIPEGKGEIDLVGYDGSVLAFVEVKTRSGTEERPGQSEEAITAEKRRYLERMARRFMAERRARRFLAFRSCED